MAGGRAPGDPYDEYFTADVEIATLQNNQYKLFHAAAMTGVNK